MLESVGSVAQCQFCSLQKSCQNMPIELLNSVHFPIFVCAVVLCFFVSQDMRLDIP